MTKILSLKKEYVIYVAVLLFGLLMSAMAASAATTISTNISTGGTLTVDTTSILTGDVTMSAAASVGTTLTVSGASNLATASSTGLVKVHTLTVGTGSTVSQVLFGTCYVDLPSFLASTTRVVNCTATGVTTSHVVFMTPASTTAHIIFTSASTTANDTIQVAGYNTGAVGTLDPGGAIWAWMAVR